MNPISIHRAADRPVSTTWSTYQFHMGTVSRQPATDAVGTASTGGGGPGGGVIRVRFIR